MKKFAIFLLFFCFSTCLFSQDIIITQANDSIRARVLSVYDAVVLYTLFDDPENISHVISISDINKINYHNGEVDTFSDVISNSVEANLLNEHLPKVATSQENIFQNVFRFKPLVTIVGAILGMFELEVQYARYISPGLAIPIDVDVFAGGGLFGFAVLTGLEGVPLKHRQKSGLFLNALAGIMVLDKVGFVTNAAAGYQLMTKKGFVFNAAIGPEYNTLTHKVRVRFTLDFGFAF